MRRENKNFIFVNIILIAIGLFNTRNYFINKPDIMPEAQVSRLPLEIGNWHGKDLEVSELSYQILETRNLILREYRKEGHEDEKVFLYIIYSVDNRKVSHPPEICLLGDGFEILDKSIVELPVAKGINIKANQIITEAKNNREDLVIYWYKTGSLHTDSYLKQQLSVVLARTFGEKTAGAMIRASTIISKGGQKSALERIQNFLQKLYPLLSVYVP